MNGLYDFTSYRLETVNDDVLTKLHDKRKQLNIFDKIYLMKLYAERRIDRYGATSSIFEDLIADHLVSISGVRWKQRRVNAGEGSTPTSDLVLRLSNLNDG